MMKQVKVDNWGIYFLQRLKHFFNRTDYCDLTLQFMDNAQLKVHRLVLNACTEYFDVLERTCEMYEDYLIMPDDLQADVVVPIVNFMYTGQLEYNPEMLEKLIQTAQIMNIPVLAKLLDAQRQQKTYKSKSASIGPKPVIPASFGSSIPPPQPRAAKRPAPKQAPIQTPPLKKAHVPLNKKSSIETSEQPVFVKVRPSPNIIGHHLPYRPTASKQKYQPPEPRPTRCELPEELEENTFAESFSTISYDSKPLIVHPETTKRYAAVKQHSLYTDVLSGRKSSTINIIPSTKTLKPIDTLFEDCNDFFEDKIEMIPVNSIDDKSQVFDQVMKNTSNPKVTIESETDQQGAPVDHAKIISEVLKKYPYLVKGNKSIKLKILDSKPIGKTKKTPKKALKSPKSIKVKQEPPADNKPNYPADTLDSKDAARLISLGAENISGPWICMICGTPGKALSFTSYYSFRRHLVDVHHEKTISNRCEYCGHKASKLNLLLYHLFTKHDVPPPLHCNFPKCSECSFIAQNNAHMIKHKMMHSTKKKKCSVCYFEFSTTANLLRHIKATGHKVAAKYANQRIQCVYCSKIFVREQNLYVHLKSYHALEAKRDGIVEDSDEEQVEDPELDSEEETTANKTQLKPISDPLNIKREPNIYNSTYDSEESVDALGTNNELVTTEEIVTTKKSAPAPVTKRLLNAGFEMEIANQTEEHIIDDVYDENLTVNPDTNEYVLPNSEFTQREQPKEVEYYITEQNDGNVKASVALECSEENQNIISSDIQESVNDGSQQVQIVVSNEEEYQALMASNHPIIFDADGNPTKTLAVLTAPQTVPMASTSMQIETRNPDNVMILPDEYDCVPQTTDESNIVVVYSSQQIAGSNKQFIENSSFTQPQIVTAADLNAHYIQTSAVMTPTASSSLVQEQVVIPETLVAWDGNMPQEIVTQQTHAQEQIEIVQEEENMAQETIEIGNEEVDTQPNDQCEIQEQSNEPHSIEADTDSQEALVNEQVIETELENDNFTTDNSDAELSSIPLKIQDLEVVQESNIELIGNETELEEVNTNDETNETRETETSEVTEVNESATEIITNGTGNKQYIVTNNVGESAPKENIQNLTSEWSDDEVEGDNDDQNENAATVESTDTAQGAVVEESIENIQQEVDNHTNDNFSNQDTETDVQESAMRINTVRESEPNNLMKTQHKITSLLNDWAENDSQGEEETEVNQDSSIEGVETTEMEEGTIMEIVEECRTENIVKVAATNPAINNLVNDWEDEEEPDQIE